MHKPFTTYLKLMFIADTLQEDTKAYDNIVDSMDEPWYNMTEAQRDLLGKVIEEIKTENPK